MFEQGHSIDNTFDLFKRACAPILYICGSKLKHFLNWRVSAQNPKLTKNCSQKVLKKINIYEVLTDVLNASYVNMNRIILLKKNTVLFVLTISTIIAKFIQSSKISVSTSVGEP